MFVTSCSFPGLELGSDFAWGYWPGVSREVAVKVLVRVAQVLTEAGVSDSKTEYAHGFGQKASVLVALRFYHTRL